MSQTRFMFLLVLELSDFLFLLFLNRHFETATHCTLQPKYLMFFNIFTNKKHHFVKRKTNVPKRFVFFFRGAFGVGVGIFFFGWRLGFSFRIPEWPSSLGPALPSCAGSCLAVLFALEVGLPFWELTFLLRVGTVPRSWGWSRWPSFLGGILARVGPAFLHLGFGFRLLLGVRLLSSCEGCPSCSGFSIGHSFLGGMLPFFSRRRHQGGCQDQFQTKKGSKQARQEAKQSCSL